MPNGDTSQTTTKPRPFNDIAREFDPLMSQETYDAIRSQYFKSVVQPTLKPDVSIQATWEEFKSKTERPPVISPGSKLTALMTVGANAAARQLVAPMAFADTSGTAEKFLKGSEQQDDTMVKLLDRDGTHTAKAVQVVGDLVGGALPLMAGEAGAAPLAEKVAQEALTNAKAIEFTSRVLRGSVSFAAVEAASENNGNRLLAGLKGAAAGATLEGLFGLPAILKRAGVSSEVANTALESAAAGKELDPEVDQKVAQRVQEDVKTAKVEGRPNAAFKMTPGQRGVRAVVQDTQGREMMIPIRDGQEHVALQRLQGVLDKGGAFQHFEAHPDDTGLMNRFGALLQQGQEEKLNTITINTAEGHAEAVAEKATQDGIPAEALGDNRIELHVVKSPSKLVQPPAEGAAEAIEAFNRPGEQDIEDALDKFRNAKGATLDERGKNFYRKQLEVAWDSSVPEGAKRGALAIVRQNFPDMLPERFAMKDVTNDVVSRQADLVPKMSDERLDQILGEYGIDPEHPDVDREYFKTLGEAHLDTILSGTKDTGQGGEFFNPEEGYQIEAPTSEHLTMSASEEGTEVNGETFPKFRDALQSTHTYQLLSDYPAEESISIKRRPTGLRTVVSQQLMDRIFPGAGGVQWDLKNVLRKLGIEMPRGMSGAEELTVLMHDSGKETVYHEGLHNLISKMYPEGFMKSLPDDLKGVSLGIAEGLGQDDVYKGLPFYTRVEESYVHAAEAIRFDDKPKLRELGRMDTSVDRVQQMVNKASQHMLEAVDSDVDSVPKRAFQRKMTDLLRRTDDSWQTAFRRNIGSSKDVWYDAAEDAYKLLSPDGETTHTFKSPAEVFDYLYENDLSQLASSASYTTELRGARGSLVPHGSEPAGRIPLPDAPPDPARGEGYGFTPVSGWLRPMRGWVNTIHERLNSMWASRGQYMPLAEKWDAVDKAVRDGDRWLQDWSTKFYENLKGTSSKKQYDMFQYLTHEKRFGKEGKFGLSADDVQVAEQHYQNMKDFQADTNIPVLDYMHRIYPLFQGGFDNTGVFGPLKKPSSMGFWEKAFREEGFEYNDAHLGRLTQYLIRSGFEKKFTGEALSDLSKLVQLQSKDGSYVLGKVKWPLENYIKYVKGVPDASQQAINTVLGGFTNALQNRVKQLNQFLPDFAKLPEDKIAPRQLMNKLMVLSYAAGLGLRPAIFLRDSLQAFTIALPVFGPARFAKGMAEALTPTGFRFADEAGALLNKSNVGELYGDIIHEIPQGGKGPLDKLTRWSNALLQPSRYGHNISRAIAFHSEYGSALEAIKAYRSGSLPLDELMKDPVLWFADKPDQARLLGLINSDKDVADVAKEMGIHATELTMWAYRRGAQPSALRTGLGRIFGQYGMWPANYFDFLSRIAKKYGEHPKEAMQTTALWMGVNYAAVESMNALGADVGSWFFASPAGYGGSPHMEFIQNLIKAPQENQEGRQARKAVLEYPINFIPTSNEIHSILQAIDEGADTQQGILHLLGFKPLPEVEENEDYQRWLEEELGFRQRPTR